MPYFNSTAIKRGEYDPDTGRLVLWFPQGQAYTFCGVPQHVWDGLRAAGSKGRYYDAHIRDQYQC